MAILVGQKKFKINEDLIERNVVEGLIERKNPRKRLEKKSKD